MQVGLSKCRKNIIILRYFVDINRDIIFWVDGEKVIEVEANEQTMQRNPEWRKNGWVWNSRGRCQYLGVNNAEKRICAGVIQCAACGHLLRPSTQSTTWKRQLERPCPNRLCLQRELVLLSCSAYMILVRLERDETKILHFKHSGSHNHPRPPGALLSANEEKAIEAQIARRPHASVHELMTGDTAPGSVPLGQISATLNKNRRADYVVNKAKEKMGLVTKKTTVGFALFDAIAKLERDVEEPFIVDSSMIRPTFCCLQTEFMRTVLHEAINDWLRSTSDGPLAARHGFVTDGDHTFFNKGVLLATVVFNVRTARWIPVLYTWILKQDEQHHRSHFRNLNKGVLQFSGDRFDPKMLVCVCAFV